MVVCIPPDPEFTTASERQTWQRLCEQLGRDDVLLANLRLTDEFKDHEADLVVLLRDVGIVVVEVKGSSVWYDGNRWLQQVRGKTEQIHPVDQARDAKYALRNHVEAHRAWGSRTRVRWGHAVVTPYSSFDATFSLTQLPRWALHDRDQQAHLADRLRENAIRGDTQRIPESDDIDTIVDILTGRLELGGYDVNAEAGDRAATADRLTEQQALILRVTRLLNRIEVRGGAGSGKTVLALQQAKELTHGRGDRTPQRVALLCYSIGLAEHLKRTVAGWRRRQQPAFVGTFHEFGKQWGAPDGDRADSRFWEEELPELMGELAIGLPDGHKYDAVIVDEAQDFADSWWWPVMMALRDPDHGGIHIYADEHQRVFGREGRPPVSLVPLVLDHCLRNTRQVYDAFGPMAPSRMYARGGEGPPVRFVASSAEEAVGAADRELARLMADGWAPGRLALITTGHRHPEQIRQTDELGHDGYWSAYFDGEDVFYGHVLGCKGLERAAVVLCLNEDGSRDRARERLYVGMSRATDQLVVVGDPVTVRAVGGDQVAKRLGL